MRNIFFLSFIILLIGIFNNGFAQEVEQTYIVSDQPYYTTGSNIKYTCYLFNSSGNKVSSQIAYVDLLDDKGIIIENHKHDVSSGSSPGMFHIEDSLSTGWYYLRAYTHYQIDYCEELIHYIPVYLVSTGDELDHDIIEDSNSGIPDFNLYIEGGQIVNRANNTIVVRSKTGKDRGEKLNAWIVDNITKDSLKQFTIQPNGRGSCVFTTETERDYFLNVSDNDGNFKNIQFPPSENNAINIRIDYNETKTVLIVKLYFEEPFSQFKNLECIAKGKNKEVKLGKIKVNADYLELRILKEDLDPGKNVFQIVSGDDEIIAQKTTLIDFREENNVFILRSSEEYFPRERIPVQLILTNPMANVVPNSLSVVVRDSRQVQDFTTGISNIIEYAKTSPRRLSYFVESGEYSEEDKMKVLEENFILDDIEFIRKTEINKTPVYDPETAIILKGKAIDAESGSPLSVRALTFTQTGESPDYYFQFTEKDGSFEFRNIYFHNYNNELILNVGGNEKIIIDYKHHIPTFNPPEIVGNIWKNEAFNFYIQSRLTEKKFSKFYINTFDSLYSLDYSLADNYSVNKTYSKPDLSYDLDDYIQLTDMREVIIELLPNVKIFTIENETRIRIYHHANAAMLPDPLFLVNGKVVKDNDFILDLDVTNVKNIDVIVRTGKLEEFGAVGTGGVVAIYTRKPIEIPYGTRIDIVGYHKPKFDIYQSIQEVLVDNTLPAFNPLLYWNPELKFDSSGETTFEFYLNDLTSEFEILVQGISKTGEAFFDTKKFLVVKPVGN